MSRRKKSLEMMLESLIKNDNEKAAESLHEYITLKTREIMLGEQFDDEDEDMGDEDEITEGKFTEKPPALGKQPMTGMSGGSKWEKYQLPRGTQDEKIKGDSLKNQGRKETKAFREKPKDAPDYKDGVDLKAGNRKNRAKVR